MRGPRPSVFAALVVLAASFWLGAALVAHAQFTGRATAGPLTISTASSFGPEAPTAGVWLCLPNISVTVVVGWSNAGSGDVDVLRASSPNGPWTQVGFRLPVTGWTFDTLHLFSASVYYAVRVDDGPLSTPVRVDLPSSRCR
jgi:hypothetical protein